MVWIRWFDLEVMLLRISFDGSSFVRLTFERSLLVTEKVNVCKNVCSRTSLWSPLAEMAKKLAFSQIY
jgi:hypothetical protein